ncbi:uncharacterized protein At1g66480-like [Hibiscus syriacus]|uniref:uncharacterized protein At1g66480-like n=1 Tax=Hibiscus syriacus TaxID=106335 RepID=UPI0019241605|nr:uncharacterized protein At1g66480-like [Hibiscus syriacus]
MGNSFGGKKSSKVMKINGETFKLKTPVKAEEVVKDYPGHVLLESEAVKHYGIRAKPLQSCQKLEPKRLYFLVELPEAPKERVLRRVRSGLNMSAKDRLESLMMSRRSVSDLTLMKQQSPVAIRVPRGEVERLMKESESEAVAAQKIMELCMAGTPRDGGDAVKGMHWKASNGSLDGAGFKKPRRRLKHGRAWKIRWGVEPVCSGIVLWSSVFSRLGCYIGAWAQGLNVGSMGLLQCMGLLLWIHGWSTGAAVGSGAQDCCLICTTGDRVKWSRTKPSSGS